MGKDHWATIKRVLKHLHGNLDYAIYYQGILGFELMLDVNGFLDANYTRDLDHKRYASGYVFKLFEGAINWMSEK